MMAISAKLRALFMAGYKIPTPEEEWSCSRVERLERLFEVEQEKVRILKKVLSEIVDIPLDDIDNRYVSIEAMADEALTDVRNLEIENGTL
jgi:hypothetical protein